MERPELSPNVYVNHKGQLYMDLKFLSWRICVPIDGVRETELYPSAMGGQDHKKVLVVATEDERKINIRLDFFHDW